MIPFNRPASSPGLQTFQDREHRHHGEHRAHRGPDRPPHSRPHHSRCFRTSERNARAPRPPHPSPAAPTTRLSSRSAPTLTHHPPPVTRRSGNQPGGRNVNLSHSRSP